ncbi:MAG TPA: hypothetical protein VD816_13785 [Ohtaekwangia sp.]|nr:hypothetical protein [Ohtaekwangia sp.]
MKTTVALLLFLLSIPTFAQDVDADDMPEAVPNGSIGIGLGLDYGGIGLKVNVPFTPRMAFLFGGGYNLNGIGLNGGFAIHLAPPDAKVQPALIGLYGYNAVIIVEGSSTFNKTYYGPSFGFALEFHGKKNFFNAGLLIPIRPASFNDDMDRLKSNGVHFGSVSPVAISLGYHFGGR